MAEAELLLEVDVEVEVPGLAGDGQVMLSVTGADVEVPEPGGGAGPVVAGPGVILVATEGREPVTVRVYDGRPELPGSTLVHTARLVVGTDGVDVGAAMSTVDHWVPVREGPVTVEVWVHRCGGRGEVTFVLSR